MTDQSCETPASQGHNSIPTMLNQQADRADNLSERLNTLASTPNHAWHGLIHDITTKLTECHQLLNSINIDSVDWPALEGDGHQRLIDAFNGTDETELMEAGSEYIDTYVGDPGSSGQSATDPINGEDASPNLPVIITSTEESRGTILDQIYEQNAHDLAAEEAALNEGMSCGCPT